jgi:hypothetical protein
LLLTAGAKGKRRRSRSRSPWFLGYSYGSTWTHMPPVAAARGADTPPLSLQFQKAFPPIPGVFGVIFVIFKLYLIYLNFLLFCRHVITGE